MTEGEKLVKEIDNYTFGQKKSKEPALKVGTYATGVAAVVVLLKVFFPNLLSDEQWTAISTFALIALPFISAIIIRMKVWSPNSVIKVLDQVESDAKESLAKPTGIPTRKPASPPIPEDSPSSKDDFDSPWPPPIKE